MTDDTTQHGHTDGAAGVPPDAYETILVHEAARDRITDALASARDRLSDVRDRIASVKDLREDLAATEADVEQMRTRRAEARQDADDAATSLEAVEEEQSAQKARGSAIYAGLYTVAGLFFIAGDVIMSREIVANALKLRGDAEPWIFAIGLAMLAVLLKPAYDRLVEKPYWNGSKHAFAGVIAVCSLGALSTLWILGAFRSTAFVSNARIQRLTGELMQTSDPAAIQEIQTQIGTIQQSLMESPLGYWAFVLSGVLFALAGAVCLGIGLRHLRDAYHVRYRLYRAHQRLDAERDEARSVVEAMNDRIPETKTALARLRQSLQDAPSLDDLRDTRTALQKEIDALKDERADLDSRIQQARYRRGHALGKNGVAPAPQGDGAPTARPHASSSSRPYRALRDVLKRDR